MRSSSAVLQRVPSKASRPAVAHKHTRLHIGDALWSLDAHSTTRHEDLAGNIDGAPLPGEGVFAPRLTDLSVLREFGVGVDGGPCTGGAVGEGDGFGALGWDGDGDEGLDSVYPGSCWTPDGDDDVFGAVVDEVVGVVTVLSEPDTSVVGSGVGTGLYAERGDQGACECGENVTPGIRLVCGSF